MSSRFPSSALLRRLGITSPAGLDLTGDQTIVPTAQILDVSKTIASEPIEARAYKDAVVGLGATPPFPTIVLECIAAGGLVVEAFQVEDPLPAGYWGPNLARFTVTDVPLATFTLLGQQPALDIGGVDTRSRIWGATYPVVWDPAIGNWEITNNAQLLGPALRVYVPSGSLFVVMSGLAGLQIALTWREIEEPVG